MSKYKTVVIDPPWPIAQMGGSPFGQSFKESVCDRYKTATLNDIIEFPIDDYAADESLLFLWVTNSKAENTPVLHFGFHILEEWGFTYHQCITWDKINAFAIWSPLMARTEHCLMGYRGSFPVLTNKQNGVMYNFLSSHSKKHSEKPAKFYQMLRAWTPEPRIDLFARRHHVGFDGWGDEYVGEGPLEEFLK